MQYFIYSYKIFILFLICNFMNFNFNFSYYQYCYFILNNENDIKMIMNFRDFIFSRHETKNIVKVRSILHLICDTIFPI